VSGQVLQFPRRQVEEVPVTYKQLGRELELSRSQLHVLRREGMPSEGLDYKGRRIFLLSKVRAFLDARQRRLGRTG
jgi:hypothetical protein